MKIPFGSEFVEGRAGFFIDPLGKREECCPYFDIARHERSAIHANCFLGL